MSVRLLSKTDVDLDMKIITITCLTYKTMCSVDRCGRWRRQ